MQLGELYEVEEQQKYAAHVENGLSHQTRYISSSKKHSKLFDCSHINLKTATAATDFTWFV